jgi:hypothetical protein
VANVERHNAGSATLEQHVGEPAGGGADVETLASSDINVERIERMGELEAATSDVRMIRCDQLDVNVRVDRGTCLARGLAADEDLPGKNQCPCTFTRRREAAFDDELVEAGLGHQWGNLHPLSG